MKRPLCLFVVSFAVVSVILQIIFAPSHAGTAFENSPPKGMQVYLIGRLYKKEIKNDCQIYYLKEVRLLEPNEESSQINKSKENSNKQFFHSDTKKTQETGAVCYMRSVSLGEGASVDGGEPAHSEVVSHPIGIWLCVKGTSLPFEQAENDGQFDAAEYYESIGYHLRVRDTEVLSQGKAYDGFTDFLVNIKSDISDEFQKNMTEENAGILSAMLLGDKTSMDPEIKNLYRKSGIAHVLAISGLHISLLGMMLYRLLRRLYVPPSICALIGMVAVVVYIKMIGLGVSSFRAVCMFLLYMLADLLHRTYDLRTALAFSAMLLMIDDPAVVFQAGFLLSYSAVLALAVVDPLLQTDARDRAEFKRQQRRRRGHPVKELIFKALTYLQTSLLSGFSIQVFLFPITLWFYYEFPLCSFLLNLIVIPCMSAVLVCGVIGALSAILSASFSATLFATFSTALGGAALCGAELILSFYEWLCRLTEAVPETIFVTGRPKLWQMVVYYVLIAFWLFRERRLLRKAAVASRRLSIPRFVFPLLCMLLFLLPVHRENRIDMLSVGQGDCICLRDETGKVVLVDGGSSDVLEAGKYRLLPFLKYHGISEIDAVFLSHAHEDHYSAILELLESGEKESVRIKTLCLSACEKQDVSNSSSVVEEIAALAEETGCKVLYLGAGDRITCGKMKFHMIYPDADSFAADENDRSMVLLAKLETVSMLFTGDSSSACDEEVIRRLQALGVNKIHCLKVAHHGAQTSTSAEIMDAFDFDVALISCGADNSYGHPHPELLKRLRAAGCEVFITAESGQVILETGDSLRVRKYAQGE